MDQVYVSKVCLRANTLYPCLWERSRPNFYDDELHMYLLEDTICLVKKRGKKGKKVI